MISREEAIRRFVEEYTLEVPKDRLEDEIQIVRMDLRHRMTYAGMSGQNRLNPLEQQRKLESMREEIEKIAYYNVKEDLVMKELTARSEFAVSAEELQDYAQEMAKKEKTSLELIKKFFGEDLAMLEGDLRRRKAEDWICAQNS